MMGQISGTFKYPTTVWLRETMNMIGYQEGFEKKKAPPFKARPPLFIKRDA